MIFYAPPKTAIFILTGNLDKLSRTVLFTRKNDRQLDHAVDGQARLCPPRRHVLALTSFFIRIELRHTNQGQIVVLLPAVVLLPEVVRLPNGSGRGETMDIDGDDAEAGILTHLEINQVGG